MRIVITSPPKSGNHWIKCLLGTIYGLEWIGGEDKALSSRPEDFRRWVEAGSFPDGSIFHQHCRFSRQLADEIEAVPARIVTIVRDPYDVFVSLFYWVQERAERDLGGKKARPRDVLIGKALDHPDVLAYLEQEIGASLNRANEWLHSGRATVVRYERLHSDPVSELTRATEQIEPVGVPRLKDAIEACRAENMRQMNEKLKWHVRSAKAGDSRERLGEEHLRVFRDRYTDLIRSLGYEVR